MNKFFTIVLASCFIFSCGSVKEDVVIGPVPLEDVKLGREANTANTAAGRISLYIGFATCIGISIFLVRSCYEEFCRENIGSKLSCKGSFEVQAGEDRVVDQSGGLE